MALSVPKLTRLDKPASPDAFGIWDSPVGFILVAWQGPLIVRVHILPAGAETRIADVAADWAWRHDLARDDQRASAFVRNILFPQQKWAGSYGAALEIGFYGTDFQHDVMQHMMRIPRGVTSSYAALAQAAQIPRASRAAGSVCARNPVPLIAPCHRVLTSGGKLGHYAYGTALKRQFLDWER